MKRIVIAATALTSVFAAALVVAQAQSPRSLQDEVPKAALLTDRGAELAERLKWLRRSEASMGENHPLMPEVREQIAGVRDQLKAWAPAPNVTTIEGRDLKRRIPQMNDEDLRQLVIQLAGQVADLNKRVAQLEQRP